MRDTPIQIHLLTLFRPHATTTAANELCVMESGARSSEIRYARVDFAEGRNLRRHSPRVRSSRTLGQSRISRGKLNLAFIARAQGGQYVAALSGVEIGLWDLAGKALELPVYQLIGGKFGNKVRIVD